MPFPARFRKKKRNSASYDDDFNLKLATADSPLTKENEPKLTEFEGVQVDERIVPALEALLEAAERKRFL